MTPCPADLAFNLLARNPGKWFAHPDLFRAIRLPNGDPLPVTTALMQRVNERIRAAERKGQDAPVQKMHSIKNGAIEPVFLRMTREQAKVWNERKAKKVAQRKAAA